MAPVLGSGLLLGLPDVFTLTADSVEKASVVLATISLPGIGANPPVTLRLATSEYVGPDGVRWDPILAETPPIDHGGNWLETGWQPVDAVLSILDKRVSGQPLTDTVSAYLLTNQWIGAPVVILQAFDNLLSTSDYRVLFDGRLAGLDSMTYEGAKALVYHCVQDRAWAQKKVPERVLTQTDFPNAPSEAYGTALPILLGDWRARRYLTHPTTPGTIEAATAGVARGAVPALIIDAPTSAGLVLPKFLVSDRDIDGSDPNDARWFMYDSTLGRIAGPGVATLTNPAGGPATIALSNITQKIAVLPIEVDAGTPTPGDGLQEVLREGKNYSLSGAALLDFDANKKLARWLLPDVPPLGKFISSQLVVFYAKNAWSPTLGDAAVYNSASLTNTTQAFGSGASGTYPSDDQFQQVTTINISSTVIANWEDIKNCYIQCAVKGTGQTLQVHRAVLLVQYQAAAKVERPGVSRNVPGYIDAAGRRHHGGRNPSYYSGPLDATTPGTDLLSFDHPLYFYGRGKLDDGSGTYTGTANRLIEHPVDMVRYLLREFGGLTSGDIVESTGEFGSFATARSALNAYKFLVHLTDRVDVDRAIARIGYESLCWFKRTPTRAGAPFTAIPWDVGASVNYRSAAEPFIFRRHANHVVEESFDPGQGKITLIRNAVRVNYDWDPRTNSFADQLYITPTGSRIYIGGFFNNFTTDSARETVAAESEAAYGLAEETIDLRYVRDPETATSILQRYFDLRSVNRVELEFSTFLNGYDLNRGHVIGFSSEWDALRRYPKAGSDGSWDGKVLRVVRVSRPRGRPGVYRARAVEV